MPKPDASALAAAATEFDAELAVYGRLGDVFLKTPLTTLKHLERANRMLGEIGESETRLQQIAQRLIAALSSSRKHQEELSTAVIAHAPVLAARNAKLGELMTEMSALAAEVAELNAQVAPASGSADPAAGAAVVS